MEVQISATAVISSRYKKLRLRWKRGERQGATQLSAVHDGVIAFPDAISFTTTMLYTTSPKRGFTKKALTIELADSSDVEIGHIRIDVAAIYSKLRKAHAVSVDREYSVPLDSGRAADLSLAVTINELDHALPLSQAGSGVGSVCQLSSYAGSESAPRGASALALSMAGVGSVDAVDIPTQPMMVPIPTSRRPPLPTLTEHSLESPGVLDGSFPSHTPLTDFLVVHDTPRDLPSSGPGSVASLADSPIAAGLAAIGSASTPSSPAMHTRPVHAHSLSTIQATPDSTPPPPDITPSPAPRPQDATLAKLRHEVEERRAEVRRQLYERLLLLSQPEYVSGVPVLAVLTHACLVHWGAFHGDATDVLRDTLTHLSAALWSYRSDADSITHLCCTLTHLFAATQPGTVTCFRPASDDAFGSQLAALLHECLWFTHCNIAHEFKVLLPRILDLDMAADPLVSTGLKALLEDAEDLMESHYLPDVIRDVVRRQFFRHTASTVFNAVLDRHSGLCTMGTGLKLKMVATALAAVAGPAADELDILRQLADVLCIPMEALQDPAVRHDVCPDLNLLQLDAIVAQAKADQWCPVPPSVETKNAINLLVAANFAELEALDAELDTMDLPPFTINFDGWPPLPPPAADIVPPELSECPQFAFLLDEW